MNYKLKMTSNNYVKKNFTNVDSCNFISEIDSLSWIDSLSVTIWMERGVSTMGVNPFWALNTVSIAKISISIFLRQF